MINIERGISGTLKLGDVKTVSATPVSAPHGGLIKKVGHASSQCSAAASSDCFGLQEEHDGCSRRGYQALKFAQPGRSSYSRG